MHNRQLAHRTVRTQDFTGFLSSGRITCNPYITRQGGVMSEWPTNRKLRTRSAFLGTNRKTGRRGREDEAVLTCESRF